MGKLSLYEKIRAIDAMNHPDAVWPPAPGDYYAGAPWTTKPEATWSKADWKAYAIFLAVEGETLRQKLVRAREERDLYKQKARRRKPPKRTIIVASDGIRYETSVGGRPVVRDRHSKAHLWSLVEALKRQKAARGVIWSDLRACRHILRDQYLNIAFRKSDGTPLTEKRLLNLLTDARKMPEDEIAPYREISPHIFKARR